MVKCFWGFRKVKVIDFVLPGLFLTGCLGPKKIRHIFGYSYSPVQRIYL